MSVHVYTILRLFFVSIKRKVPMKQKKFTKFGQGSRIRQKLLDCLNPGKQDLASYKEKLKVNKGNSSVHRVNDNVTIKM